MLGVAMVAAVVIAGPSGASDQPALQPSLSGNVAPDFASAPQGRVAVVTSGPPYRDVIAFVVSNGSSDSVERVGVSVTARGPDGKVVARGTTRDVVPTSMRPGEIAIGGVRLSRPAGTDSTYEFSVSSSRRRHGASEPALEVTTTELSDPIVGSVAQRLTGEVRNAGRKKVRGPVVVTALCLNQASHPVLTASSSVARRGLKGRASTRFTIEFRELCPAYLVGARA
jgi:hypothetical protein